jgi:hypothetical protein
MSSGVVHVYYVGGGLGRRMGVIAGVKIYEENRDAIS